MSKRILAATTTLMPLPAVLVSCGQIGKNANIITIAWCGVVCSEPPLVSISIRQRRHSFDIIKNSGEFVVNIPSASMVWAVDFCGTHSGKDVDKFALTGLTAQAASKVKAPLIKEAPVNLECQVRRVLDLGSHHMFIAEIVATQVDEDYLDAEGQPKVKEIDPLAYVPGVRQYWSGLSVMHGYYGKVWQQK